MPSDPYSSTRVTRATPIRVPLWTTGGGGGVLVPGKPGRSYRVWNSSFSGDVYINPEAFTTGAPKYTLSASEVSEEIALVGTEDLWCIWTPSGDDKEILIEPLITGFSFGLSRTPLCFLLKSTDDYPRALIGTFYDFEGREMRATNNYKVQLQLEPTVTAQTVFQLADAIPSYDMPLYSDCYEFRGMLYGGPVLVMPGYLQTNPNMAINSDYVPREGGAILYPGPVVLGGNNDQLWQPSTNPGFMDPGVGRRNGGTTASGVVGTSIAAGATTDAFVVDARSSALAALFVEWTQSTAINLRIQLWRKVKTLPTNASSDILNFASLIPCVDETFTFASGTAHKAAIELEDGLYEMKLSVPTGSGAASGVYWNVQRFQ